MLSLMAMLDRQQIPEKLLRKDDDEDLEVSNAIGTLYGLFLITKGVTEETLSMHRLVQLSIHAWLEQHDQKAYYAEDALTFLAKTFPNGEHENRQACETLYPHAQAALLNRYVSRASLKSRATLLCHISWFDWRQGRYNQSYKMSLEICRINQEILSQHDPQTLLGLSLLASLL
jgi:hypothetical protein